MSSRRESLSNLWSGLEEFREKMLAPPSTAGGGMRGSIRRYSVNFPLTGPPPGSALNSKSSGGGSDLEENGSHRDVRQLGIDPSHYLPGAPITTPNGRSLSISSAHSAIAGGSTNGLQQGAAVVASSSSFTGSDGPRPTGLGLLHCTMQHFPVRKRLRVNILKIEGLAGALKPDMEMHAQCKVAIPGLKTGKEQASEVKRGRDPVFNQEFFFDNVCTEDLDTRTLVISAMNHGGAKLGKDIVIGEITINLHDIPELHSKKEVKFCEEFKQNLPKKLGKIHITSCIEKDARRLTINIKKADDLPRWGFLGAPDVCVKITLVQGSGLAKTKCSRILKSTTAAVYNEAVMFIFNPTKIELAHTQITISVHDMQRTCTGDDVIGCSYLGILAQDKSEVEQWKSTIEHMGKEYKGTHHLKHPSLNPPTVRVADAAKDDEHEDEEEREEGFEF